MSDSDNRVTVSRDSENEVKDNWGPGFESASAFQVILAAHAMAGALCLVEWSGGIQFDVDMENSVFAQCPCCGAPRVRKHRDSCVLDRSLTAAGLSPENREEVRKALK